MHFFGYCLIFASALAVCLRIFGAWKSLSFEAVHRLMVLGFLGVLMNVVSGMFMMLADSYRYVAFPAGLAALALALVVLLGFWVRRKISGR